MTLKVNEKGKRKRIYVFSFSFFIDFQKYIKRSGYGATGFHWDPRVGSPRSARGSAAHHPSWIRGGYGWIRVGYQQRGFSLGRQRRLSSASPGALLLTVLVGYQTDTG
jgi:hypothetical protein